MLYPTEVIGFEKYVDYSHILYIHLSPEISKALKDINIFHITVSIFLNILIIQIALNGVSET